MSGKAWKIYPFCIAACVAMIAIALHFWGTAEIRANLEDIILLSIGATLWLLISNQIFPWLGLSARDDAMDRQNVAALVALSGAIMACALIYAGGSGGEGPSYLNNVFSVGLGAAGFFGLWIMLEVGTQVSTSIAEERDLASGLRLGGFLLASGLLIGRAVAGDWHSKAATIRDFFRDGWPACILWMIALMVDRSSRPSRSRINPSWQKNGLLPALSYLAMAA